MAKLNSGTRIFGTATVDTSIGVGTDVFASGSINAGIIGTSNIISGNASIAANTNAQSLGSTTIAPGASVFVPVTSVYKITTF